MLQHLTMNLLLCEYLNDETFFLARSMFSPRNRLTFSARIFLLTAIVFLSLQIFFFEYAKGDKIVSNIKINYLKTFHIL